jgi:hypothetical protein
MYLRHRDYRTYPLHGAQQLSKHVRYAVFAVAVAVASGACACAIHNPAATMPLPEAATAAARINSEIS